MTPTQNNQFSMASHAEDDGIPVPPHNFDEADDLTEAEFKRLRRFFDSGYRELKREINTKLSNPTMPPADLSYMIELMHNAKRQDCHRLRQLKAGPVPHEEETDRFGDELLRKRDSELIKEAANNNMKARELLYMRKLMRDAIKMYGAWERECIRRWATLKVVQFLDLEVAIMFKGDMGRSLFAPCFWPSLDVEDKHQSWVYGAGGGCGGGEDSVNEDGQPESDKAARDVRNVGVTSWECKECHNRGASRTA